MKACASMWKSTKPESDVGCRTDIAIESCSNSTRLWKWPSMRKRAGPRSPSASSGIAPTFIPRGLSVSEATALRSKDPKEYVRRSRESIAIHMRAMLDFLRAGSVVFDYGNNIRGQAKEAGVEDAFAFQGFVPLFIRPLFAEGRGPFRWVAVTGNADDIVKTDSVVLREFPNDETLARWIRLAEKHLPWEGLPARVCWLGYGERAQFGRAINRMVASGELSGPIVITRDHLDAGSVASPYRETEGMRDGSDAIADWPLLNALLNTAAGADLVAIHNGGGVGIGYSTH